jgi:hypothetical protein
VTAPNPRLQRTRAASPPSPLSRQPLGAALGLVGFMIPLWLTAAVPETPRVLLPMRSVEWRFEVAIPGNPHIRSDPAKRATPFGIDAVDSMEFIVGSYGMTFVMEAAKFAVDLPLQTSCKSLHAIGPTRARMVDGTVVESRRLPFENGCATSYVIRYQSNGRQLIVAGREYLSGSFWYGLHTEESGEPDQFRDRKRFFSSFRVLPEKR